MIKVLQRLLRKIDEDINAGNSNISEEEALEIVEVLKEYTRKDTPMSKYEAFTYLNVSRATFDNYVADGRLPKGQKRIGFKELCWYKRDLDEYLRNDKKNISKR